MAHRKWGGGLLLSLVAVVHFAASSTAVALAAFKSSSTSSFGDVRRTKAGRLQQVTSSSPCSSPAIFGPLLASGAANSGRWRWQLRGGSTMQDEAIEPLDASHAPSQALLNSTVFAGTEGVRHEGSRWGDIPDRPPHAGLLSRLSFAWVGELMRRGNNHTLQADDLWNLRQEARMGVIATEFESQYAAAVADIEERAAEAVAAASAVDEDSAAALVESAPRGAPWYLPKVLGDPVVRALWGQFRAEFLGIGLVRLVNTFVQFFPALIVRRLLRSLEGGQGVVGIAALQNCILLFTVVTTKTIIENQYFYLLSNLALGVRGVLSTAVYRKSLRLSPSARQNATVGEIVNYMQLDAGRVENMASYLHPLWDSVLQIAGYSVLLYRVLGPSAVLGMAIMASLIPTNTFIFRRLSAYRMEMLEHTDHRVRVVNEMLQGIRAIKFYHWESAFRTRVESIHEEELGILQRSAQLRSFLVSLLTTAPTLVIVATLTAYSLMGNTLHPSTVFAALALFNQLRFPLYFLPVTLSSLAEGKPSIDRLSNFFAAEEVVPYVQRANHAPRDYPEDVAASISAGAFTWVAPPLAGHVSQPQTPLLHGIELEVKKGELVAIIGEVGSGKSSVLSALLGEMRHVFGTIYTQGSLAFVPQSPWIPNDTVRGNILFGSKYDAEKYAKVVETCGLTRDLGLLEFGDETEIGEQGINLSGGQKQRLSIARALYKSADLFLLDDPLSALDAQVAQDVFEKCVQGAMAERGATRVLVTNQLQFLPRVDRVIMMGRLPGVDGSTIVDQGTYEELISRGHDLKAAVGAHDEEEDVAIADGHAPSAVAMPSLSHLEEELVEAVVLPSVDPSSPVEEPSPPSDAPPPSPIKKGRGRAGGGLMSDEDRATGAVARSVYTSYLSSAAKPMVLGMLGCLFLVSNTAVQLQQWVVSFWTSDPGYVLHPLRFYLAGVTGTAAVVASLTHLRTVFAYTLGIRAARRMHRTMLQRVLHAPVSFFDSTPVGRIVQRFSKDTDSIDQSLVGQLIMLINAIMGMVGSLGAIMVATPPFALVVGPLAAIYIRMMNYFRPVARELQRLDSITRSPVYAHFGETLGGLTAIRAFGHTPRFARTNEMLLNANLAAYLTKKAADRWLNVRLELMGNVVVLMSGLLCVQIARGGRFVPGLAGLAITNALSVTGLLNWVVRCYSETEAMMTGVERVLYTSRETVQEAPHAVNCHKKSSRMGIGDELSGTAGSTVADHTECPDDDMLLQTGWPWEGAIEFRGVNMRYRSDVGLALKDVDLAIRPGEKVGIVGRTGSGKSSLNKVLFRIVEPETGTILLDGVDCGRVGLGALRSRLTIIPQDPVLFSGTLRTNLDPFGDHSDEEIWDALDAAKLGAIARALQGGLSHPIAEYGENFSVGQRQLICLARALLRRTRVLLLDEATSSIDYSTDKTIQEAISVAFENCTVLTVAHRLETIRNSDRVLVMDDGKVVEFAPPDELASNPNSRFAQLLAAENNQKSNNNGNNRAPATHANGASVLTPAASGGAAVA